MGQDVAKMRQESAKMSQEKRKLSQARLQDGPREGQDRAKLGASWEPKASLKSSGIVFFWLPKAVQDKSEFELVFVPIS